MAIRARIQAVLYLIYLFALLAVPGAILWGPLGSALGLLPLVFALAWVRLRSIAILQDRLEAKPLPVAEAKHLHHYVQEFCRRLGTAPPILEVCETEVSNIAIYGYAPFHMVVSRQLLKQDPALIKALVARALVRMVDGWVPSETLLASILACFDEVVRDRRTRFSPERLVWKLAFSAISLPGFRLLVSSSNPRQLDESAARLCSSPWELAEALRVVQLDNERKPYPTSLSVRHLYTYLGNSDTPLAPIFFQSSGVEDRIRILESRKRARQLLPQGS